MKVRFQPGIGGRAEGGAGLWLHGWLGSGRDGAPLAEALGRGLWCPDLPGHGDTPLEGWTLPRTLERIAELARGKPWTGGYSMGGRLLMMAAAAHPDCFHSLVLESAFWGYGGSDERAARLEVDAARAADLEARGLEAFCRDWYAAPMWGEEDCGTGRSGDRVRVVAFPNADFAGKSVKRVRSGDPEELAGALPRFSSGRQPDLRPWLRSTSCRILWLAGRRDRAYAERAGWIAEHTRHRVELLDTGHAVHFQDPAGWAGAVRDFLEHPNLQQEP